MFPFKIFLCLFFLLQNSYGKTGKFDHRFNAVNASEQFKTNQDYLNSLKILIQSSQETKHRIQFIKDLIKDDLETDFVLDIGIGNGEITQVLCNKFNTIHLVDPSTEALNLFNDKIFKNKNINKFNCSIENYNFQKNYYNFIVNAHTLYHVERKTWKQIIQRSFNALKTNGIQLVVLNTGLGRSHLTKKMGGCNTIDIESLIEDCIKIENSSVKVIPVYETFKTKHLDEAVQIAAICLHDNNITASKEKLEKFLIENYKVDREYRIDFCQYFIIIKKVDN